MGTIELKCQIAVSCGKHVISLLSLLVQHEIIHHLSEKHVNFSNYNVIFKEPAIIYMDSQSQMKSSFNFWLLYVFIVNL